MSLPASPSLPTLLHSPQPFFLMRYPVTVSCHTQVCEPLSAWSARRRASALHFAKRIVLIGSLLLSGVLSFSACKGSGRPGRTLELEPCQLSAPTTQERLAAKCGVLKVPSDRKTGQGKTLDIHVAVLEATSGKAAPDALMLIAGGPGQSAISTFTPIMQIFERSRRSRDVVLVDIRGTGRSHLLQCPEPPNPLEEGTLDDTREQTKQCLEQLQDDPRHFTTVAAMQDLDAVREALGYPQVTLFGHSYGSRAALVYMRMFPEKVRAAILSGVAPPHQTHYQHAARYMDQVLQGMFSRCQNEAACQEAFPQLEGELEQLLTQLEGKLATVKLQHPRTGKDLEVPLSRDGLAGLLLRLSYSTTTLAMLPVLIHSGVTEQDLRPLAAQGLMTNPGMEDMAVGLNASMTCSEDRRLLDLEKARAEAQGSLFGTLAVDHFTARCEVWPAGELLREDALQPVVSSIPTLLISGELDPVTPPESAEAALAHLSKGRHIVVKDAAHDAFSRGCAPRLMAEFISKGQHETLDVTCLEQQPPIPFFLNRLGPRP